MYICFVIVILPCCAGSDIIYCAGHTVHRQMHDISCVQDNPASLCMFLHTLLCSQYSAHASAQYLLCASYSCFIMHVPVNCIVQDILYRILPAFLQDYFGSTNSCRNLHILSSWGALCFGNERKCN